MISASLKTSARLAAVAAILLSAPAFAGGFDGPWSVTIATQSGNCDAAYAFPMRVAGGRVITSGGTTMSGSVSGSGAVNVSLVQGSSNGRASGRLSATSGGGTWSGTLNGSRCSGYWQATRQ
ncbi:MAG: hypothetical protein J0I29_05930 [Rhizobiales bacterium]|nr:hypothetical protein [Hyphomicrobiales bacterium]